jgi:hypothetical protein
METKPAYKTTEFYVSVLAMIVGLLASSGVLAAGSIYAQIVGIIASALVAMGYSMARGVAKSGNPPSLPPGQ